MKKVRLGSATDPLYFQKGILHLANVLVIILPELNIAEHISIKVITQKNSVTTGLESRRSRVLSHVVRSPHGSSCSIDKFSTLQDPEPVRSFPTLIRLDLHATPSVTAMQTQATDAVTHTAL
ncbi:hypothetical protein CBL_10795 [Carabus blaptoides fortunei]